MLGVVVLAATMYVCPGNVFTDVEQPGCKPFVEHQGTVNVEPNAPQGSGPAPSAPSGPSSEPDRRRDQPDDSINAELCGMYKEYIDLEVKTQGGFQASSPEELQRWQTLKRMFQSSPAPRC